MLHLCTFHYTMNYRISANVHCIESALQDALTATELKLDLAKKRLYFPAAKGYG